MPSRRRAGADVHHRAGPGPDLDHDSAVAALQALYDSLPSLTCKGLCAHSCSHHVDASDVEHARAAAAGVDLDSPTPDEGARRCRGRWWPPGSAPSTRSARWSVACGAAASMPCPHRCAPAGGLLDDGAALSLLAASLDAGGHRDAGVPELLTACMDDPQASALMAARLRGNRAVEPALAARLREIRRR